MLLTLPVNFTQNPTNTEIVKAFNDKKRNASDAFQLTSYAATQVIGDAIKGAGSSDPSAVAKYLHANTFDTLIGKISWNKQGDLIDFKFDVYSLHKDGSKSAFK